MMEVIQLAKKNQCNFRHLESLKNILKLLNDIPIQFYYSIRQKYQNLIDNFEKNQKNRPFATFYPSADNRLLQLRQFDPFLSLFLLFIFIFL